MSSLGVLSPVKPLGAGGLQKPCLAALARGATAAELELCKSSAARNGGTPLPQTAVHPAPTFPEYAKGKRDSREQMTCRDSCLSLPAAGPPCVAELGPVESSLTPADRHKASS